MRIPRGRSRHLFPENMNGTHEQRMGATPVPQGALGRITDVPGLLGRHSDATTVSGRHSDNRGIVGRLLDIQQSNNVPKSPENEMSVQLSPESEDAYRLCPNTERASNAARNRARDASSSGARITCFAHQARSEGKGLRQRYLPCRAFRAQKAPVLAESASLRVMRGVRL